MSSPSRVIAMIVTNTARAATVPNMELAPVDTSIDKLIYSPMHAHIANVTLCVMVPKAIVVIPSI